MTTLEITATSTGATLQIRCNLAEASSVIEVNHCGQWCATGSQCADVRHRESQLAEMGARLLFAECGDPESCDWEYCDVL